jgi:hydrogenase nickel incorporation protein HypA/HybF
VHEIAIAQSIIDLVNDKASGGGFTRVYSVTVAIGALSSVEPDSLSFGFDAVAAGTLAQGATLIIDRTPGKGFCVTCVKEIEVSSRGMPCPTCDGHQWLVVSGEELTLKNLEVD